MIQLKKVAGDRLEVSYLDTRKIFHRILYTKKEIDESKLYIQKSSREDYSPITFLLKEYKAMPNIVFRNDHIRPHYIVSYFQIEVEPSSVPYLISYLISHKITDSSTRNLRLFINSKNKIYKVKFE